MLIFWEQIHYLGHLVSGVSILPLTEKIKAVMKLKPPTNIKEVRHFLGLNGYCRKIHMQLLRHWTPFTLFNMQVPAFHLDPGLPIPILTYYTHD